MKEIYEMDSKEILVLVLKAVKTLLITRNVRILTFITSLQIRRFAIDFK